MLLAVVNIGIGLMIGALWLTVWAGWAAWVTRMGRPPEDAAWKAARRWLTLGAVALLLHSFIAFDNFHNWSHEMARITMELRTAEFLSGGIGAAVYLSYLFLVLWALEVAWSWAGFASWQSRPRGLDLAIQGFLHGYGVALVALLGGLAAHHVPSPPLALGASLMVAALTWWGLRARRPLSSNV